MRLLPIAYISLWAPLGGAACRAVPVKLIKCKEKNINEAKPHNTQIWLVIYGPGRPAHSRRTSRELARLLP